MPYCESDLANHTWALMGPTRPGPVVHDADLHDPNSNWTGI